MLSLLKALISVSTHRWPEDTMPRGKKRSLGRQQQLREAELSPGNLVLPNFTAN